MRTVRIGVQRLEVSKSEAEYVGKLQAAKEPGRITLYTAWLDTSPTEEARLRRVAVGKAFGIDLEGIVWSKPANA
jgi:hypothetical protein